MFKIRPLEIISIAGTAWAVYNIGLDVSGNETTALISGLVATGVSLGYLRGVVDRAKKIYSTAGVIFASTPFVIMWLLNANTVYHTYLNTYVDRRYSGVANSQRIIAKKEKELIYINSKISDNEINIGASHLESDFIKTTVNWKKAKYNEILKLRNIWAESERRWATDYYKMTKNYKKVHGSIPDGEEAILALVEWKFNKQLKLKHSEDTLINSNIVEPKALKKLRATKQTLIKEKTVATKNLSIKKAIEKSSVYTLDTFYLIMLAVGIFIEIFMTHSDYWFRAKPKRIKKEEDSEISEVQKAWIEKATTLEFMTTIEKDPFIFIETIGLKKANREADMILSMLLSWSMNIKPTVKKIEKYKKFKSPKTGTFYKYGNFFYTVRRDLRELGLDMNRPIESYSPLKIKEILANYFLYQSKN